MLTLSQERPLKLITTNEKHNGLKGQHIQRDTKKNTHHQFGTHNKNRLKVSTSYLLEPGISFILIGYPEIRDETCGSDPVRLGPGKNTRVFVPPKFGTNDWLQKTPMKIRISENPPGKDRCIGFSHTYSSLQIATFWECCVIYFPLIY